MKRQSIIKLLFKGAVLASGLSMSVAGLLPALVYAEPVIVANAATSDPAGQRKIFYDSTFGRYWIFYRNSAGNAMYKTFDGANLTATERSVFVNDTSGLVSVWYNSTTHIVFAVSGVSANLGPMYVRAGHIPDACAGSATPNTDCAIDWGTELTVAPSYTAGCFGTTQTNGRVYTSGAYPAGGYPMGSSIAQSLDGKLITAAASKRNSTTLSWGVIGQYGISVNTSDLTKISLSGGTIYTSCYNNTDSGSAGLSEVFVSVVPVADVTTSGVVAFRDANSTTGNAPAMAISKVPGNMNSTSGRVVTNERSYNVTSNNVGTNAAATAGTGPEGNGWSMAVAGSSVVVHAAYVSGDTTNSGDLMYLRRTAGGTTTNPGTWTTPFVVDASGTNPGGARIRFPSVVYVKVDGTSANDRVYVFYQDINGGISYVNGPTGTTDSSLWDAPVQLVESGNHPQVPAYAESPYPMAILYEGDAGLSLDLVPISPYDPPNPAGAVISTTPTTAPYTTNTYTLRLANPTSSRGSYLRYPDTSAGAVPVATILLNGAAQSFVTAGNVSVVGTPYVTYRYDTIDIPITLTPGAGFSSGPYDIKITNADGRTATFEGAFSIPEPQVNVVSDVDPADGFTSGSGFSDNSATSSLYRNITITGKGFMEWNSSGTVCARIDKNPDELLSGVTVSTCGSVTALSPNAGNSSFTAKLKISTNAAAGVYYVRVINPTLQEGFYGSPDTTFYLTLTTAVITAPALGNGLTQNNGLNLATTGFTLIKGGQSLWPDSGQAYSDAATYATQLKLKRIYDGYYWNGDSSVREFQAAGSFASEEKYWFSTKSSGTWIYNADDTTKWGISPSPTTNS